MICAVNIDKRLQWALDHEDNLNLEKLIFTDEMMKTIEEQNIECKCGDAFKVPFLKSFVTLHNSLFCGDPFPFVGP